jgi:hypothetical protein
MPEKKSEEERNKAAGGAYLARIAAGKEESYRNRSPPGTGADRYLFSPCPPPRRSPGESPSLVLVINDTKLLMLLYQV